MYPYLGSREIMSCHVVVVERHPDSGRRCGKRGHGRDGGWVVGGAEDGRRNGESRYGLGIWGDADVDSSKPRQRWRVVGRDSWRTRTEVGIGSDYRMEGCGI